MKDIAFKVPDEVWRIWRYELPYRVKALIKHTLIELIRNHSRIKINIEQKQSMTIYNVVMPQINVSIKSEGEGNNEVTREYVNVLKKQLSESKLVIEYYKQKIEHIKRELHRLNQVLAMRDIHTARTIVNRLLKGV